MRTYLECIPCVVAQTLDACRMATADEELQTRILRRVLRELSEFSAEECPARRGQRIHRFIREQTGNPDPYREVKHESNAFALRALPELQDIVRSSTDPFETAARLAIAGNIIDWGAKPHADTTEEGFRRTLQEALVQPLDADALEELRTRLQQADNVLYLCDNAGEIVLDGLFVDVAGHGNVTLAVKGQATINDATMEDAQEAGLTDRFPFIDNGCDAPGTVLEECSDEFSTRFADADLVIAKGQGNYESLNDSRQEIFFLLKAKCPVVAGHLGCEKGRLVIVHKRAGQSV